MAEKITLIAGQLGHITLATSPAIGGATVVLTALFGTDGVSVGSDADDGALSFPVSMQEGGVGVYSAEVGIENSGLYFAEFEVDGAAYGPVIVRVVDSASVDDASVDQEFILGIIANATSVSVTITDREGTASGYDSTGEAITWPKNAVQVDGHSSCWYVDDLVFTDGGKYHVAMVGPSGPVWTDTISVTAVASSAAANFDGWKPSEALPDSKWISVGYIRRNIGWSASVVSDQAIKELRKMAITTFVETTGRWFPAWNGTWHGLRGQGRRLYLPMNVLGPMDGSYDEPAVVITTRYGSNAEVQTVETGSLVWRQHGADATQPFIEAYGFDWDPEFHVKITGSFGSPAVTTTVKEALLGLIRWHSLSYGVGPDEARDRATLNRITSESSRDRTLQYADSAIGSGITGDPTIDRLLMRMTINPGPWAMKHGDACVRGS